MLQSLSVIIPTLNEEQNIAELIDFIKEENLPTEIIVSDGLSNDNTAQIAAQKGAVIVAGEAGRGKQLNRGAEAASGDLLLFMHADSTFNKGALRTLFFAMEKNPHKIGGAFKLKIDSNSLLLNFISWSSNLRAKYLRIIFGDQAIFVRREVFDQIGGFPDIELMEDWEFSKKLADMGELLFLDEFVYTSARKWEENGVLKTILLMHKIKILYKLGINPKKLKQIYYNSR